MPWAAKHWLCRWGRQDAPLCVIPVWESGLCNRLNNNNNKKSLLFALRVWSRKCTSCVLPVCCFKARLGLGLIYSHTISMASFLPWGHCWPWSSLYSEEPKCYILLEKHLDGLIVSLGSYDNPQQHKQPCWQPQEAEISALSPPFPFLPFPSSLHNFSI